MRADLLFGVSQEDRVEYPGDGVGEKVDNIPPAARPAGIMGTYATCAETRFAAVPALAATSAADDTAIKPVSARFWIFWHDGLRVRQYRTVSAVLRVLIIIIGINEYLEQAMDFEFDPGGAGLASGCRGQS
jgi:hypothetical protein